MTQRTCVACSGELTGRQQKYCSHLCSSRAQNQRDKETGNASIKRQRQASRRAAWQRDNRQRYFDVPTECEHCGESFMARRGTGSRFCSRSCANIRAQSERREQVKQPQLQLHTLGPLRGALERGDSDGVVRALLARTVLTLSGCREWQGQTSKGYPVVKVSKSHRMLAHRVMGAAVHGPIGPNPVHHTCANRLCIEPTHLQVVTPIENTAEMLERRSYLARIASLEAEVEALTAELRGTKGRARPAA